MNISILIVSDLLRERFRRVIGRHLRYIIKQLVVYGGDSGRFRLRFCFTRVIGVQPLDLVQTGQVNVEFRPEIDGKTHLPRIKRLGHASESLERGLGVPLKELYEIRVEIDGGGVVSARRIRLALVAYEFARRYFVKIERRLVAKQVKRGGTPVTVQYVAAFEAIAAVFVVDERFRLFAACRRI